MKTYNRYVLTGKQAMSTPNSDVRVVAMASANGIEAECAISGYLAQ